MSLGSRVDAAIDAALGSRIVGCVVLVSRATEPLYARAAGLADREANLPARENTIFRFASITKPIVATTALRMIDLGLLSLDEPVTKYLSYFTPRAPDGSMPPILIRHLLAHISGLAYDNVPKDVATGNSGPLITLEENLRRLARQPLSFVPGTAWRYGMSIDVLGGVLAAINRSTLGEVVARYVTDPLGMSDSAFSAVDPQRLAVPYADGRPPVRMAEPATVRTPSGSLDLFSPARIFQPDAPQSGGAGMAGTAADVMKLLDAWRGGDLLAPATRKRAVANQIGALRRPDGPGRKFSFLGALIDDPAEWHVPAGTLQWGGSWGNNWIFDPAPDGYSIVVLTNTAFEGCNGAFRTEIRDAVFLDS